MWQLSICFPLSLVILGLDMFRVEIQPLDISASKGLDFSLRSISQIESDGRLIYLRSKRDATILVITPEGEPVRTLGGKGAHPAEFPNGVLAMAVRANEVWAIDNQKQRVRQFVSGRFEGSFPLDTYNVYLNLPTSNVFAFSDRDIVIPTAPDSGHLAAVYDRNGKLQKYVGEPFAFTSDFQHQVPGINDTYWLRVKGGWFSIHKFVPLITHYDDGFRIKSRFSLDSPRINALVDQLYALSPAGRSVPPPTVTDVKYHDGRLYLMIAGQLHRVRPDDGAIENVVAFYGTGPDFAATTAPNVSLFFFSFLDQKTLVLGHPAMMWNHDLWLAAIP